MPHLSPTTLTTDEQRLILRATAGNVRDHTIISLALGTGLRLAEIVGLDVGDVVAADGTPRVRVRVRAAIAKGGRAADVFLPDRLTRLVSLPLLAPVVQEEILALARAPGSTRRRAGSLSMREARRGKRPLHRTVERA